MHGQVHTLQQTSRMQGVRHHRLPQVRTRAERELRSYQGVRQVRAEARRCALTVTHTVSTQLATHHSRQEPAQNGATHLPQLRTAIREAGTRSGGSGARAQRRAVLLQGLQNQPRVHQLRAAGARQSSRR